VVGRSVISRSFLVIAFVFLFPFAFFFPSTIVPPLAAYLDRILVVLLFNCITIVLDLF